jgi:hypothetical protein
MFRWVFWLGLDYGPTGAHGEVWHVSVCYLHPGLWVYGVRQATEPRAAHYCYFWMLERGRESVAEVESCVAGALEQPW